MEEVEETIGSGIETRSNERKEKQTDHRMRPSVGAFMLRRNNFNQ